ncbi:MAG: hypothetical protein PWQ35_392 [Patescibacteria group bacterium]|nr:hypothetical protein [Patescibacteria group bacterium]
MANWFTKLFKKASKDEANLKTTPSSDLNNETSETVSDKQTEPEDEKEVIEKEEASYSEESVDANNVEKRD